jgi:hypothetical protein
VVPAGTDHGDQITVAHDGRTVVLRVRIQGRA